MMDVYQLYPNHQLKFLFNNRFIAHRVEITVAVDEAMAIN